MRLSSLSRLGLVAPICAIAIFTSQPAAAGINVTSGTVTPITITLPKCSSPKCPTSLALLNATARLQLVNGYKPVAARSFQVVIAGGAFVYTGNLIIARRACGLATTDLGKKTISSGVNISIHSPKVLMPITVTNAGYNGTVPSTNKYSCNLSSGSLQ